MNGSLHVRPHGRICPTGNRVRFPGASPRISPSLEDAKRSGVHTPRYGLAFRWHREPRANPPFYGLGCRLGGPEKLRMAFYAPRPVFYALPRTPQFRHSLPRAAGREAPPWAR